MPYKTDEEGPSIRDAILIALSDANREMYLEEIYSHMNDNYLSTDFQNEPDPNYPYATRLQHGIRSALAILVKEGKVIRTKRAHYMINNS